MLQRDSKVVSMGGDNEEERDKMVNGGNGDEKWREKMLEEDFGLWTVECLRGRLLAERAASKVANRDAELLGNKLVELEKQLRLEVELKNKAEKKLKFLMGKLESLKLSSSRDCSSSVDGEDDSSSSTACSGTTTVEKQKPINSEIGDIAELGSRTSSVSSWAGANHSCDDTCSKKNNKIEDTPSEEQKKGDFILRQTPASGRVVEEDKVVEEFVANTIALATTCVSLTSVNHKSCLHRINDAPAALRRAKEHLQNSTGGGGVAGSRPFLFSAAV